MCGIYAAVLSNQAANAQELVFEGIKRIEYRGYDSWGVAALDQTAHRIKVEKHIGKISEVNHVDLPAAQVAIGHTRWATHGGVTETNAHPHLATDESFALVQNGIVENYQELKQELSDAGFTFISQTDTEVIVRLIERELRQSGSMALTINIFAQAMRQLEGRSTVAVMTITGNIFAYRNGSPLVVGRNQEGNLFLSSDVLSLATDAHEYVMFDHGQIVSYVDHQLQRWALDSLQAQPLAWQPIQLASTKLDKEGFGHFMLKEIYEQTELLHQVLSSPQAQFDQLITMLRQARCVYTLGAGSASYAASLIADALRRQGINAMDLKSYEARSYRSLFTKSDVAIAISQSGETADTNEVVEWMREAGMTVASIVNMPGSTLTAVSDLPFMLNIGPEVSVASTKAIVGQMVWGLCVARMLKGDSLAELQSSIQHFEQQLKTWMDDPSTTQVITSLTDQLMKKDHLYVLGRGQLYASALEFAIKLKEISYIHAEGFTAGELKHGVIALIEEGTPVVCLVTEDDEKADMLSAAAEVKARGAHVIGVATQSNELFDTWIPVPENADFVVIASIIPAQLLTYRLAVAKRLDPDKPRNLAKSVTVK